MKNNWLDKINRKAGKAELVLKKNSPEILLGIGIVSFVGTVVTACQATLRADEVLDYHKRKMKDIHDAKEIVDQDPEGELEYDEHLYRHDVGFQYMRTAGSMLKLYAPSIALGGLSLACILTSRNIMQKRYLGVVAAYNGLSTAFEEYRKRVREEYGEGLDRHFRYGTTYDTLTEVDVDENGKKKKNKVDVEQTDSTLVSPNDDSCRFFDSSNPNWDQNPNFSMMWLRGQQDILNDILHTRGHVFLNEVYDALGFDHTPQGAILGWVDDGSGDGFIDFGLYDQNKENVRRFVNGVDNVILLEFNHDGIIWNKI